MRASASSSFCLRASSSDNATLAVLDDVFVDGSEVLGCVVFDEMLFFGTRP